MPLKGQLTGVNINCEWCGKQVYKTKSQFAKAIHHFCSVHCQKEYLHNETYETRYCEICGKPFEVAKKDTKRFCSIQCQGKWQSTQIGDLNPRSKRTIYSCDNCGEPVKVMPCEEKLFKHHFCCNQCRMDWYSNVFSQNEEWKKTSQKRAITMIQQGSFNHTNTKPQMIINELLTKMKIDYVNEKEFDFYAVDNYLPKVNLIIEVMGDYWHSSPIRFNYTELSKLQKTRITKDRTKHHHIAKSYHIEILYLWENDIINHLDMCEDLIRYYIDNKGKLCNYHSFNFSHTNGKLALNKSIIIPYQDMESTQSMPNHLIVINNKHL